MKCGSDLIERLHRDAEAAQGREICGLLLGTNGRIEAAWPLPNAAEDKRRHFLLDPAAHLRASREARRAGTRILGCYHSHPNGDPSPSSADAAGASEQGFHWLILAGGGERLWRSRAGGAVHRAFDPLELRIG
jgi:proteasome lid subunit RPN8/RPN11